MAVEMNLCTFESTFLKGQEYKIVQKYVHKIHKICTISNIFGQSYIPD